MRRIKWTLLGITLTAMLMLLAACSESANNGSGTNGPVQELPEQEQPQPQQEQSVDGQHDSDQEAEPPKNEEPAEEDPAPVEEGPAEGAPPTALEAAATVMRALSRGDMNTLSAWAHPDKGVRFSPYAYVDIEHDLVFTRDELSGLMDDRTKRVWGTFAGSGDLIELTYAEYHARFVYDAAFIEDGETSLNAVVGEGTTVSNLNEAYPADSHDYVEYHIDGIDPAFEGMDWRSIRLVFEKIGGDRALVGIVHDQWTP